MRNKVIEAREFLEARQVGAFEHLCEFVMVNGGVLHMAADCFLAGVPCEDDAQCLHVVFQCSELPSLYRLLRALPYEFVEWRRDFGHSEQYGCRRRAITEWGRKLSLAERLNRKDER